MQKKSIFISQVGGRLLFTFFLFFPAFCCQAYAQSDAESKPLAQLLTPLDGSEVIAKKPVIKCAIVEPYLTENLLVLFDGVDITGVLKITSKGFEYTPISVLPSGSHTLSVSGKTQDGDEFEQEFSFSTRHSKSFEEAYSNNELTAFYENVLKKPDDAEDLSDWKFNSNLSSQSMLNENGWQISLDTNIRYVDQELPLEEPEKKGLDLVDFLISGTYSRNQMEINTEIGDTQIDESENTVSYLARRGGKLSFQYSDLNLSGFVVKGEETYGFEGGMGIDTNDDDHIMGASAEMGFFNNRVSLKAIYVTGGEKGSYFGTYSADGPRKGEASGVVLKTDFFDQKLTTEFEIDHSIYDSDTSDDSSSESDKAYRIMVGGETGSYTYEALYKFLGPEYEVIGNQGLDKDTEGLEFKGGAHFEIHSIDLTLSDYWDNVENDNLYPRIYTYQGMVDYSFNKFQSLPMGLSYEKAIVDSSEEPEGTDPTEIDTDTVSGTISYTRGPWGLGLLASYSNQDDKTDQDDDTTTTTYSLTPTYTSDHFAISTGFNLYNSEYHLTDIDTDTYTVTLDIRGDIFHEKITYELSGTYDWTKSSDDLTDQNSIRGDCRLAYLLGKNIWGYLNPSVGIKALYDKTNDRVSGEEDEEFAVTLMLSASIPFSF